MGTTDAAQPTDPTTDPAGAAAAAAAAIAEATGVAQHSVAIVLGSGWQAAADRFGEPTATIRMADLPGFAPPSASGHSGTITSVNVDGTHTLLLQGRTHAYEGHELRRVVHPVRTAIAAGAGTIVLTNAAGGIRDGMAVGQPVLIADHLNLTARSPLIGAEFVDLVDAYSTELRDLARSIDPSLEEGVYAGLPGPHYETPAEIRMLRIIGADLVGMSTVHETIAARALGARVLGVSLVTNLAAGMTGEHLDHKEVLEAGKASAARMGELLHQLVSKL
ncbi:purine-nucleoside phosphorylase [Rhodococcus sp. BGS-1C]|uniref:purine-nucleoside phosphorylase n=1 Tax=unclassified Rhodococcus (in: high G+C Gram-positive bacteria) TaxID=192944 RepID=UPI0019D155EE|nr:MULTISPECIES: purine-nucleoside phosphorylase [unclassified Rhodococcus (in: high G+C Gram-positive bacteria)]MCC8928480.1 purine-nucleoside phosphorylase [Rhodococcus sp. I2R]